jgi:hypothetical protein
MAVLPGFLALAGFGGSLPVEYTDEGTTLGSLANPSTATVSSTREKTLVCVLANFPSALSQTIDSATLDGNSMTKLVSTVGGAAFDWIAAAIFIIDGAVTAKTLSVSLSATPVDIVFGVISLSNIQSEAARDTDVEGGTGAAAALTNLTTWVADGITVACGGNGVAATAYTWTNLTELRDNNTGRGMRGSYGADLDHDPNGTVKGEGASSNHATVGVTLR